jgi:hypothetical protein
VRQKIWPDCRKRTSSRIPSKMSACESKV